MDAEVAGNRAAWEIASQKHVREYDELLTAAAEAELRDTTMLAVARTASRSSSYGCRSRCVP